MLSAEYGIKTSAVEPFQDEWSDEEGDGSADEDIAGVVGFEDDARDGDGDDEEDHEPFQPRVEPPEGETQGGRAGSVAAGEGPEIGSTLVPERPRRAELEAGGRRGSGKGIGAKGAGHERGIGEYGTRATEGHFEDVRAGGDGEDSEDNGEDAAANLAWIARIQQQDEGATEGDGEEITELLSGFKGAADVAAEGNRFCPLVGCAIDGPGGKAECQEYETGDQAESGVEGRLDGDRTIVERR